MDRGSSKRVRGNARNETAAATTTKKAKEAVTKTEEVEEVVVEERKEGEGLSVAEEEASAAAAEGVDALWSGVDEGMPWATCWFPFWEMEAALYGDVWDYDIWGLKATNNVPPNH